MQNVFVVVLIISLAVIISYRNNLCRDRGREYGQLQQRQENYVCLGGILTDPGRCITLVRFVHYKFYG